MIQTSSLAYADEKISICHGNGGYPPYHYRGNGANKGQMTGITIDVLNEIFKSMGREVEVTALPWKRCYELVKAGKKYQIIADGSYKKSREKYFLYSQRMHVLHPSVIVRKNSTWANKKKLAAADFSISDHTLCANRGTNLSAYQFSDADISLRTNGVEHGLSLVLKNRCQAYLTLQEVAASTILRSDIPGIKVDLKILPADTDVTFDLHLMISKASKDPAQLKRSIDEEFQKLDKSGRLEQLWSKYR
ncbi:MAG: transporter substrate-binding domain-containing protein [Sneathiella sp.]|nr:transporter substrate-binding domain-containing protein [Sneathiella sp.]